MGFFGKAKRLKDHLTETKLVTIKDYTFVIKKISVLNFLEGAKVMAQTYETYTNARNEKQIDPSLTDNAIKKAMDYYRDVLCAGVVVPKITREPSDDPKDIHVELMFIDMEMCGMLCEAIMEFTHGKKKSKKTWWRKTESETSSL